MDRVALQTCANAALVGGTCEDPQPWGLPAICPKGVCIFQSAQGTNWIKKVDNDHTYPPAYPSIGNYHFLLVEDGRFGSQDLWLAQSHHTLTYARVLQHWAEKAQLPNPSEPCHLAGSIVEIWWVMEPLVSFMENEVFTAMLLSNWVEVTLPWLAEAIPTDPCCRHSHSWSCSSHGCPRGFLSVAHSKNQPTTTVKTEMPTPPWEVMLLQSSQSTSNHKPSCPLPGFVEIACALWGETSGEQLAIGCHWHSAWGNYKPIWGHGFLYNGDPPISRPHLRRDVYQHVDMYPEYCGPGAWPCIRWPLSPSPMRTFQPRRLDSIGTHSPIHIPADSFIWHVCHDVLIGHSHHILYSILVGHAIGDYF